MNFKCKNNNSGYSLLEILVAVGIFGMIVIMATGIFQRVVDSQRQAIAAQNTQEAMRYAMEVISKEIRHAQISNTADGNECEISGGTTAINKVFNLDDSDPVLGSEILYFKNKNGDCVYYYLEGDMLKVRREKPDGSNTYTVSATPDEVKVSDLKFIVKDDDIESFHNVQPEVTIRMNIEAKEKDLFKSKISVQTTVSSRYYE